MSEIIKINLGCGNDIKPDYLNVDFRKTHPSVIECDLSKTPWPWNDEYADEVLMLDFLEHFSWNQTAEILQETWRILKPNGHVIIQVPDFEQLSNAVNQKGKFHCSSCGFLIEHDSYLSKTKCKKCGISFTQISREAIRRLYGGQDYVGNYHMTAFTPQLLGSYMTMFDTNWEYLEEEHQRLNWNFKIKAMKAEIQW